MLRIAVARWLTHRSAAWPEAPKTQFGHNPPPVDGGFRVARGYGQQMQMTGCGEGAEIQ